MQRGGFGSGVERERAVADGGIGAPLAAADEGEQACGHFIERKGLAQIIVGTAVEPGEPVGQGVSGGEYQHWCALPLLAPISQNVHAVDLRQTQIEHHRIIWCGAEGIAAALAVFKPIHGKTVFDEAVVEAVADMGVVFNQ